MKIWISIALVIEIVLIVATISIIITEIHGYWWLQLFRLINVLRAILLVLSLRSELKVVDLFGSGKLYKSIRSLSVFKPLGIWVVIGFIDTAVFRLNLLIVDPLAVAIALKNANIFLFVLGFNILYVLEFPITLYMVYTIGVVRNVYFTLVKKKKKKKTKIKRKSYERV